MLGRYNRSLFPEPEPNQASELLSTQVELTGDGQVALPLDLTFLDGLEARAIELSERLNYRQSVIARAQLELQRAIEEQTIDTGRLQEVQEWIEKIKVTSFSP